MKRNTVIFTCISILVFLAMVVAFLPETSEVAKEPSIDIQFLYNFKTQQHDPIAVDGRLPTNLQEYLPQDPAAQNMYALLVGEMDVSPLDAFLQVMDAYLGEKADD